MELSTSNIKKILTFPKRFSPSSKNKKSFTPRKFHIIWEIKLSSSNIYSKESFSYILGKKNSKNLLYFGK